MKQVTLLTILAVILSAGTIEAQPDTMWTRVFGGPANEQVFCSAKLTNGEITVVGVLTVSANESYVGILTLNSSGDSLSTARLNRNAVDYTVFRDTIIILDPIAHGFNVSWTDLHGREIRSVEFPVEGFSTRPYFEVFDDGSSLVSVEDVFDSPLLQIFRISDMGDTLWTGRINSDYDMDLNRINGGSHGSAFVAARETFDDQNDLRVVGYRENGQIIFDKFYTETSSAFGIWEDDDDGYLMLSFWGGNDALRFIRLDSEGEVIGLNETIELRNDASLYDAYRLEPGAFIITGSTANGESIFAAKVSISGEIEWQLTIPGSEQVGRPLPVIGDSGLEYIIAKYNSTQRGRFANDDVWAIRLNADDNSVGLGACLPNSIMLLSTYPNPFNSSTVIEYQIDRPGFVKLGVIDGLGRSVGMLDSRYAVMGSYRAEWNARALPAGKYNIVLTSPTGSAVRGVTLVR